MTYRRARRLALVFVGLLVITGCVAVFGGAAQVTKPEDAPAQPKAAAEYELVWQRCNVIFWCQMKVPKPPKGLEPAPQDPTPAPQPDPKPDPAPDPTPGTVNIPAGSTYVHLGDSYSSGAGGETTPRLNAAGISLPDSQAYELRADGKRHACARAHNSAAKQIAAKLKLKLIDASCGGANTSNILSKNQFYNEPRQADFITPDTKLVTLTIGGNDAALLFLLACGKGDFSILQVGFACMSGYDALVKQINGKITNMGKQVAATLALIRQKAPGAQIRIAGYPYLLPLPETKLTGTCAKQLTVKERTQAKQTQDFANATIKAAAEAAGPNVRYVDPHAPGNGFDAVDEFGTRDMCSSSPNRWMNGQIDPKAPGAWHPNSKGYEYYAKVYLDTL